MRDESGFLLSFTSRTDEWVTLEQMQLQSSKGKSQIASTTGEILELTPFRPLLSPTHLEPEWDQDAPGLKELSAQVSGSQLLEPAEPRISLESLQNQVEDQIKKADLQAALTLLRKYLQPGTPSAKDWIILQSQFTRYEQELRLGLLNSEEKEIKPNRLSNAILSFLYSIQE